MKKVTNVREMSWWGIPWSSARGNAKSYTWGGITPCSKDRLGIKLESSFAERDRGILVDNRVNVSSNGPLWQRKPTAGLPGTTETGTHWSESREGPSKMIKFLEHVLYKERLEGLGLFNLKRKFMVGIVSMRINASWAGGEKKAEPDFPQW